MRVLNILQGECVAEHGEDEQHRAEHGHWASSRVKHIPSVQGLHRPVVLHHRLATGELKRRERSQLQRQQAGSQDTAFMIELLNISRAQLNSQHEFITLIFAGTTTHQIMECNIFMLSQRP